MLLETPWGNLKKGLIDLVISLGIAFTYYFYNGSQVKLYITNSTFTILHRCSLSLQAFLFGRL